jgi:hypothetical protein
MAGPGGICPGRRDWFVADIVIALARFSASVWIFASRAFSRMSSRLVWCPSQMICFASSLSRLSSRACCMIFSSSSAFFSTKYAVSRDISVPNYSVSRGISVQNMQSAGIFQY